MAKKSGKEKGRTSREQEPKGNESPSETGTAR